LRLQPLEDNDWLSHNVVWQGKKSTSLGKL